MYALFAYSGESMTRHIELIDKVGAYNPETDQAMLSRAYDYAMKAHGSQKRASGEAYITHPLEVASILADLRLDDASIAAALLHDTIEDTPATQVEIEELFGTEIADIVQGLTKINKLDLVSRRAKQAENFRKLLLSVSDDVRVLLIKLADRLHNMRTLDHVAIDKRERIARETMDIYAPLAGRMGMQEIRSELEDLAFRYLTPEGFQMVSERLEELHRENSDLISEITDELGRRLADAGIKATVAGREKRPYSIWRKLERKSVSFEQLSDIYAFRITVKNVADAYHVLGIVHTTWPMVPTRFKDYISTPKQNDYQSIHTTVIGPGRQRVELQIRTHEMDDIAEYGIAAHAFYKDYSDGKGAYSKSLVQETKAYRWLRQLVDSLEEGDHPEEFLEHTKLDLFHDQVFCFTPKGRLIALPMGAKPIDFAYAVHTDIGNTCVGCKVNGKVAPLFDELHNGDEVEIICSDTQTPPLVWADMAVTGKAKAAVRRATREAARTQYTSLGQKILERAFQRAERTYSKERLEAVLGRLAFDRLDDALVAVGRGETTSNDVLRAVYPDYQEVRAVQKQSGKVDEGWFGIRRVMGLKFKIPGRGKSRSTKSDAINIRQNIPIHGLRGDLPVDFASKGAVPGDRIVGILEPDKGITIYPIDSPSLRQFDNQSDAWLDVMWDIDPENTDRFPTRIRVMVMNEPGALGDIATLIGEQDGNIDSIDLIGRTRDFREMIIDIEVWDNKHLNGIISQLRKMPAVTDAERVVN
jgi:GTP diphosphokinase / guanosine-3',5'-bis(diphosphate) 3'-diphosphatase